MSLRTSCVISRVIEFPVREAYAITLVRAPWRFLILDWKLFAMYSVTSSGTMTFSDWAFFLKMATLVS